MGQFPEPGDEIIKLLSYCLDSMVVLTDISETDFSGPEEQQEQEMYQN